MGSSCSNAIYYDRKKSALGSSIYKSRMFTCSMCRIGEGFLYATCHPVCPYAMLVPGTLSTAFLLSTASVAAGFSGFPGLRTAEKNGETWNRCRFLAQVGSSQFIMLPHLQRRFLACICICILLYCTVQQYVCLMQCTDASLPTLIFTTL